MTDPADRPSPVVLVHSPLLGPSTWRRVGEQLADRGHEVAVPDLRAAASTGDPHGFVTAAAAGAHEAPALLVGHSGAGWLLPCIGDAMSVRPQRLVFVDAGIPPCAGTTTVSADFLPQLRRLARRGLLPPWSQWWGRDVLAALLPDPAPRRTVLGELPQVPLAFFEIPIAVPGRWCGQSCAYVRLSDSYRAEAERARGLGWPVTERTGSHLDVVSEASAVTELLDRWCN